MSLLWFKGKTCIVLVCILSNFIFVLFKIFCLQAADYVCWPVFLADGCTLNHRKIDLMCSQNWEDKKPQLNTLKLWKKKHSVQAPNKGLLICCENVFLCLQAELISTYWMGTFNYNQVLGNNFFFLNRNMLYFHEHVWESEPFHPQLKEKKPTVITASFNQAWLASSLLMLPVLKTVIDLIFGI